MMEGFQATAECHHQALDILRDQVRGLPIRQPTTMVTSQPLFNPAGSSAVTLVSRGDSRTCRVFLSQRSLVFELQPSLFPAYIITLMSWRVLAWATAVWEQQSTVSEYTGVSER